MENLKKEFENLNLFKCFEIEVKDKTGQCEHILFNITFEGAILKAQHVALSDEEDQSPKIAFKAVTVDPDLTLDENLQDLYDECIEGIILGDKYDLID